MNKSIALGFIFFISFFLLSPTWIKAHASNIIFQDNFENGNINGWTSITGPDLWQFKNFNGNIMYGARIENASTIIDSVGPSLGTSSYRLDFDYLPITNSTTSSVDRNLDFRWVPDPNLGWKIYEVHFLGEYDVWTNFGYPSFASSTPLSDNQINHITVIFQNQHMQLFLNGIKIIDYLDTSYDFIGTDRIGLRISTGGSYPTEVWFDNIVVTSLDENNTSLNVPYFSQNDNPWGPTEYDDVIQLGFSDPTMNRWGCAVTSAAMVLNFHNIKEMPDGTDLDPGSLNVWLKNNNGYAIGYKNMDGWYSYLKFPSISTLTKRIFDKEKSDIKLEYKRAKTNLTQTLDSDLSIGKFPDIIKVSNNETSSHFVVAKGKSNNTYLINDPEWNHPTLESFNNNTFSQLDRFIPSNTNLSYFLAVINPGVEMMITAPDNKKTGKSLSNNEELNQIDNASYSLQLPISNPNDKDQNENLGTGVNEFLLSQPADGNYEITLSSEENGFYEINLATFKKNGDNDSNYIRGIITKNNDETLIINYSQIENSYISKTFNDLIKDLNELKEMNQFKNNGIYNSLLAKATAAQLVNFVSEKTSNNILKAILNELKVQKGKGITEDAYQILYYDINYLINNQ